MEMNNNIKTKQAKKYFQEDENIHQIHDNKEKEKINLIFNLLNGKINYSYGVRVEIKDKNLNDSFFSEMVECTNLNRINLLKYKECDFYFGKEQKIKFEVIIKSDNGTKNYPIYTTIGEIIGNKNGTKFFYINGRKEIIEVVAENEKKQKFLTVHFILKIASKNKEQIPKNQKKEYYKNEKYKIYFLIAKNNTKLYESEVFTDDGKFNIVQIPLYLLKLDYDIRFFNYKNQEIGHANTNLSNLIKPENKEKLIFQKKLPQNYILNIYNYSSIKDKISFIDYIKSGIEVALEIGIDFTGSNGHPDDENTLHCRRDDAPKRNPYERAILACAKVVAPYDLDQLFPVYGFGAIINGQKEPSMCFNINFKQDPNIKHVDTIIEEYYSCLNKITFSGPTIFTPIIKKVISEIKNENNKFTYHILMMLTDGKIEDLEDTIDALVEGSFLPLSVIIIGIGDSQENLKDFKLMEQLDADDMPLISRSGIKRQRDLVQFVPFYKFEGDEKKLAEEVLDEIPRQINEYYTLNFIYPEDLKNWEEHKKQPINNISKIKLKESLNQSISSESNNNANYKNNNANYKNNYQNNNNYYQNNNNIHYHNNNDNYKNNYKNNNHYYKNNDNYLNNNNKNLNPPNFFINKGNSIKNVSNSSNYYTNEDNPIKPSVNSSNYYTNEGNSIKTSSNYNGYDNPYKNYEPFK